MEQFSQAKNAFNWEEIFSLFQAKQQIKDETISIMRKKKNFLKRKKETIILQHKERGSSTARILNSSPKQECKSDGINPDRDIFCWQYSDVLVPDNLDGSNLTPCEHLSSR